MSLQRLTCRRIEQTQLHMNSANMHTSQTMAIARGYIFAAFHLAIASTCRYDVISECFSQQPKALHNSSSSVFPFYSDEALNDLCSNHTAYTTCMEPHLEHCPLSERRAMESKNAALSFLCSDQLPVYRSVRSCVASVESAHCNRTYSTQMSRLLADHDTLHNKRLKICRHTLGLVGCLRGAVEQECGHEASEWLHDMKMSLLSPTLHELGCVQNEHLGSTAIIAIVVALVLAFLCICVISAIFRRKAARHTKVPSFTSRQSSHKKSSINNQKPQPGKNTNGNLTVPGRSRQDCTQNNSTGLTGPASVVKEDLVHVPDTSAAEPENTEVTYSAENQQKHVTNGAVKQQTESSTDPNSHHEPQTSSDNAAVAISSDNCDTKESKSTDTREQVNAIEMQESTNKPDGKDGPTTEADDSSDEYTAMLNETCV